MVSILSLFFVITQINIHSSNLNVHVAIKPSNINYKYAYFIVKQENNKVYEVPVSNGHAVLKKSIHFTRDNFYLPIWLVLSDKPNIGKQRLYRMPRIEFAPDTSRIDILVSGADVKISGGVLNTYFLLDKKIMDDYNAKERILFAQGDSLYSRAKKRDIDEHHFSELKNYVIAYPESPYSVDNLYSLLVSNYVSEREAKDIYRDFSRTNRESKRGKELLDLIERRFNSLRIGTKAPVFEVTDISGKKVGLKDYSGKYLLVVFWASWCGPCRAESSDLIRTFRRTKDSNLEMLSISVDLNRVKWRMAVVEDSLIWRQAIADNGFQSNICKQYSIEFIPSNFLISPEGYILAKNINGDGFLDKVLKYIN